MQPEASRHPQADDSRGRGQPGVRGSKTGGSAATTTLSPSGPLLVLKSEHSLAVEMGRSGVSYWHRPPPRLTPNQQSAAQLLQLKSGDYIWGARPGYSGCRPRVERLFITINSLYKHL